MSNSNNDLSKVLINLNQEKQLMEDALRNIFNNTIHRSFDDDPIYKAGVLGNIKMAIGEEKYKQWEDYYL